MSNTTLVDRLIDEVIDKLEEFGLENVTERTFVSINKNDEIKVFNSDDFNTFTKVSTAPASWMIDSNGGGGEIHIDLTGIEGWVGNQR